MPRRHQISRAPALVPGRKSGRRYGAVVAMLRGRVTAQLNRAVVTPIDCERVLQTTGVQIPWETLSRMLRYLAARGELICVRRGQAGCKARGSAQYKFAQPELSL